MNAFSNIVIRPLIRAMQEWKRTYINIHMCKHTHYAAAFTESLGTIVICANPGETDRILEIFGTLSIWFDSET